MFSEGLCTLSVSLWTVVRPSSSDQPLDESLHRRYAPRACEGDRRGAGRAESQNCRVIVRGASRCLYVLSCRSTKEWKVVL